MSKMKLHDAAQKALEDAKVEYGEASKEYKIIELSLPHGIEHITRVCAEFNNDDKLTRRQLNKNRKKAKQDAYNYLYANKPEPQAVGMGLIAGFIFWFAIKQALWYLAGKLLNYFLFDDTGED